MDPDIIALQEALAHQEELVRQMSEELYQQQKEILTLKRQMAQVIEQVKTVGNGGTEGQEPPPPHY